MARKTSKWLKQMTVKLMLTPSLRKLKNFPFNPIPASPHGITASKTNDDIFAALKISIVTRLECY
jgi:hypothetical protein